MLRRKKILAAAVVVTTAAAVTAAVCHLARRGGRPPAVKSARSSPGEAFAREQFVRNAQFWGEEGQNRVEGSAVIVVGLGGVGSHCAVALARAGVRKLKLIDFDRVTLSSLNRHACATHAHVGLEKSALLKEHIEAFNPWCEVELATEMFTGSEAPRLLAWADDTRADFVIDCIDNVPTKVELIKYCMANGLDLISSGGAGGKCDPTRIRIDPLANVTDDELARAVRTRLRAENRAVDISPITFVYSCERDGKGLLPLKDHQITQASEFSPLDTFRVRIVPVLGAMPAMFGYAIACHVLSRLAEPDRHVFVSSTAQLAARDKLTRKNYRSLLHAVVCHVNKLSNEEDQPERPDLSFEDARDVFCERWGGASAITGKIAGPKILQLVPWERLGNLTAAFNKDNLVCLTQAEAKTHLEFLYPTAGGEQLPSEEWKKFYPPDVVRRIELKLSQ